MISEAPIVVDARVALVTCYLKGGKGGVLKPENDASGSVFVYSVPWLGSVQCL